MNLSSACACMRASRARSIFLTYLDTITNTITQSHIHTHTHITRTHTLSLSHHTHTQTHKHTHLRTHTHTHTHTHTKHECCARWRRVVLRYSGSINTLLRLCKGSIKALFVVSDGV
jgi:hypothetical protein